MSERQHDTATLRVRRLGPEDLDALYALRLEALATDPDAFLRTHAEEVARGPAQCARALADGEGNALFGAFGRAGELVGMTGVQRELPEKLRHRAAVWGMFVRPSHRGFGLGGRLLDEAIAHARSWPGVLQVHLSAEASHYAAIRLYESRGFVVWGREPRGTMHGQRALAELHLWLDLGLRRGG